MNCRIYNTRLGKWWKRNAHGYCESKTEAGIYGLESAAIQCRDEINYDGLGFNVIVPLSRREQVEFDGGAS